LVENLNVIAQIYSYYITNNKSELSHYSIGKFEEEIQQILKNANLYKNEEEITLEKVMAEVDLE